jgi:hypothetical protein
VRIAASSYGHRIAPQNWELGRNERVLVDTDSNPDWAPSLIK